jgi:CO/xanthine dehydrogenase Mo-binding subunit
MSGSLPLISQWVRCAPDGTIVLSTGKVELGQGAVSAIAQMGCHELGIDPTAIRIDSGDTESTPNEWYTAGSISVESAGQTMRKACAQARELALAKARERSGNARQRLDFAGGVLLADGQALGITLAEVLGGIDLNVPLDHSISWRTTGGCIGLPLRRLDLRAKMAGGSFIQDIALPGMLCGRVVRAPNPAARLVEVNIDALHSLPGVQAVVVDGSFVGLVTGSESEAIAACDAASGLCRWEVPTHYPKAANVVSLFGTLEAQTRIILPAASAFTGDAAIHHSARFTKPAIAHASIGPSCAIATLAHGRYEVHSHSQGVYPLRDALARVLGVSPVEVHVRHVPGAGCYGHNGADDAALDACLLARAVPGRSVKVTWSRADELGASPMGSPMMVCIDAALKEGRIVNWQYQVWSGLHGARPGWDGAVNLLAATQLAKPFPPPPPRDITADLGGGGDRNACAIYDFGRQEVLYHFVPGMPLRTSSLRALGSFANLFAIESFMDELAVEADIDPLAFRLAHLSDPRAQEVLRRVARMANWRGGVTGSEALHQGLAFGRYKNKAAYIGMIAQVEVGNDFRVDRIWACVDAGEVINPDGLANQIEGGIVQSLSWTLLEEVRFSSTHVEAYSWEHYPILPFSAAPRIEIELVQQADRAPLGVGEVAQGPTAAAVANALSRALQVRLRDLPLTREKIMAAAE